MHPSPAEFKRLSKRYNLIPVTCEVAADLETPVSCYLKAATGRYSFLLESVEGGEKMARYSFIGVAPSAVFESRGRTITLTQNGRTRRYECAGTPLDELESLMRGYRQAPMVDLPAFTGGAVGFMGYDVVRFFEKLPDKNRDAYGIPDALFLFTDTLLAFDHLRHRIRVICNVHLEKGRSPERAYAQAARKIQAVIRRLERPLPKMPPPAPDRPGKALSVRSNMKPSEFRDAVLEAKKHIRKGDIFQVVLSQAFSAKVRSSAAEVYRALRSVNPSPYMFLIDAGDFQLVGSSPEVHVRCEQGRAMLRPIAGTRRRGADEKEDLALEKELLADTKERAEHLMLVDLGRNDLGRVCEFSSVKVPEFMTIERYSHVMHIVSLVEGRLAKGKNPFDLLRATFPAGTVSGAPKVRAMEIIDRLENRRRSFYAGIVGYFGYNGNLDSCITIRTILMRKGVATVQAGAGIVADSVPENEYQETVNKAKALLRAIEIAERSRA